MADRKPISKRTRFEVFKRDSFTCQYCGATPPSVILHVDHIDPVANGGKNSIDNLVTACESCNQGKSDVLLSCVPKSLKEKAEEIKEREAQIKGFNKILVGKANRIESETWSVAAILEGVERLPEYRKDRLRSIRYFLEKIPFQIVSEAADFTNSRWGRISDRAFRYFCGICWNRIREDPNG